MSLVTITGIDEVRRMLNDIAPQEARKLMRSTVHAVAKEVADDAKQNMQAQGLVDSGDMVAGTYAKQEPLSGGQIRSTVRVRGAFYWRFLEFGDGPDHIEHAMFMKARERMLSVLDSKFLDAFARNLVKRLQKGR